MWDGTRRSDSPLYLDARVDDDTLKNVVSHSADGMDFEVDGSWVKWCIAQNLKYGVWLLAVVPTPAP